VYYYPVAFSLNPTAEMANLFVLVVTIVVGQGDECVVWKILLILAQFDHMNIPSVFMFLGNPFHSFHLCYIEIEVARRPSCMAQVTIYRQQKSIARPQSPIGDT